jgi:YspA, cpYpsA-related SLOG family
MEPNSLFHARPAAKPGGAHPDRCPNCQQVTFVRKLRWQGSRWERPNLSSATCTGCGATWELGPMVEPEVPAEATSDLVAGEGRPLRLAIVGSRTLDGHPDAWRTVRAILDAHQARCAELVVLSAGARGIDRMAATEARRRGLAVVEYMACGHDWPAYCERDQHIAHDCDRLVHVVDRRSRTYGSGWTRDRARQLGKPTEEYVLDSLRRGASRNGVEAER